MARRKLNAMTTHAAGFTLVELAVTILLVAIMAVFIFPRVASRQSFEGQGFNDQLRAAVEYARKSAVAERRNVCVSFGPPVTLTRAQAENALPPAFPAACTQPVINPATGAAYALAVPSGVVLASSAANVMFDPLGRVVSAVEQVSADVDVTVTADVTRTFRIVAQTGYVD